MTGWAISASGLVKRFGAIDVLSGVDLSVRSGTVYALLGANGAGKTTTVRILATLEPADAGRATVAGHDVARDRQAVRRRIGLTGQQVSIDERLTGRENLVLLARLRGRTSGEASALAADLLTQFDLVDAADRWTGTWSGGMCRRLDLAAGLVGQPEVLFLDEPTTGLDPRARLGVWRTVNHLTESGVTVFLTTQYLEEADQLADRIAVLDGGRVVAEGTPAELKAQVGDDATLDDVFFALTEPADV